MFSAMGPILQHARQVSPQSQPISKHDAYFDHLTSISGGRSGDSAYLSQDAFVWWQLTGGFLRALISRAEYTLQQQRAITKFYQTYVAEYLGPAPTNDRSLPLWKSFMTDDFTPIEFSWAWGNAETIPDHRIRLSIEPIGDEAGSPDDLWNTIAAKRLMRRLSNDVDNVEIGWFDKLVGKMSAKTRKDAALSLSSDQTSPSSSFVAFEFGNSKPVVKAYLLPAGRSGTAVASTVLDTMKSFAEESSWEQLSELVTFLETEGRCMQLRPCMVGIDCISQQPRVKIYIRCQNTSFQDVKRVLSVLGASGHDSRGFAELQDLWQRVFSLEDGFDERKQLHCDVQKVPGMLYYLELRPGSPKVTSKVYLPVKYYGKDDWSIATGLTTFFRSSNRIQSRIADQYLDALRDACPYRKLGDSRGIHTYITAAVRNGSIDVTSYLSPEIYRTGRFGMCD